MSRKKKKQQRERERLIEDLLKFLVVGAFLGIYYLTKSLPASAIAAGTVLGLFIVTRVYGNQKRVERLKRSGINEIDEMDGRQFEHYLGHLLRFQGYSVEVTRSAGDYGADLVIKRNNKKIVVQAKRYSRNVGLKAVQEVQAAIAHYGASEGWVIANREYTDEAYSLARSNGIRLVNRGQLIEMTLKMNPQQGASQVVKAIKEQLPEEQRMCSRCGEKMVRRKGPKGEFFGCNAYPKCRNITSV
ncbi:restriction endonuclease [Paenibacillus glycinis]|uniref:Restriction endonuclease n=1 Tax=Paenibacillus glycinis TaxID=2697035 RepID=A0ABW9XXP5_9BACL|nr:restriction endonuclease [Paenibacillus glycinis]NBD27409.1 hypothetical protein [Paenibacillus glycinis]